MTPQYHTHYHVISVPGILRRLDMWYSLFFLFFYSLLLCYDDNNNNENSKIQIMDVVYDKILAIYFRNTLFCQMAIIAFISLQVFLNRLCNSFSLRINVEVMVNFWCVIWWSHEWISIFIGSFKPNLANRKECPLKIIDL